MKTQICKKKLMGAQQMKMQWNPFKNSSKLAKNKKNDIVWLAYYQGQIFHKFKEKESFVRMFFKLNVSKSATTFKIAFSRLIGNYPKIKDSLLSLYYFKKHLKMIRKFVKKTLANLNKYQNFL